MRLRLVAFTLSASLHIQTVTIACSLSPEPSLAPSLLFSPSLLLVIVPSLEAPSLRRPSVCRPAADPRLLASHIRRGLFRLPRTSHQHTPLIHLGPCALTSFLDLHTPHTPSPSSPETLLPRSHTCPRSRHTPHRSCRSRARLAVLSCAWTHRMAPGPSA